MWFILFSALDPAADITLESRVATELWVDGNAVARLYQPGSLRVEVTAGPHEVKVYVDGHMNIETIDMSSVNSASIVVSRSGISWPMAALAVPIEVGPPAEGRVVFRSVADEEVVLTVGNTRTRIAPGRETVLIVGTGVHPMSIRSKDGTVIWVRGELHVEGDDAIVQLADGRMPEVLGQGGQFVANGG